MEKGVIGVYKITSPTGRVYIGSSKCIIERWRHYEAMYTKSQPKLHNSLKKHGPGNHLFEVIEECAFEELFVRERYWQEFYNVIGPKGLNCILVETDKLPRVYSEDTLKIMSLAMSGPNNHFYGKKFSDEHRRKIGEGGKGRKRDPSKVWNFKFKMIIDLNTGIFYEHTKEAALAYDIPYKRLTTYLSGANRNRTTLVYVEDYVNGTIKVFPPKIVLHKRVLDTSTGIIYEKPSVVAKLFNINENSLRAKLNGARKNTTPFLYID